MLHHCAYGAGFFARHVIEPYRSNHRVWLPNTFAVVERMHTNGDAYVSELATNGYLEDIQNMAGHAGVIPKPSCPTSDPRAPVGGAPASRADRRAARFAGQQTGELL